MSQDVTILYQGGSGGFALYYYLLLSGKFQHSISETWRMIDHQFPLDLQHDPNLWKTHELWPNNQELKHQPGPRLFLICNPLWNDHMIEVNHQVSDHSHRILLYTSMKLQLRMAWEKRAYWFTDVSRRVFSAPNRDRDYVRQIKRSGIDFNGITVDPAVPQIISEFEPHAVLLLKNLWSEPASGDQQKFLRHWYSLQPKKSQHLLQL